VLQDVPVISPGNDGPLADIKNARVHGLSP
jgi:hypothetical protein